MQDAEASQQVLRDASPESGEIEPSEKPVIIDETDSVDLGVGNGALPSKRQRDG